jgi:hypothetical protein
MSCSLSPSSVASLTTHHAAAFTRLEKFYRCAAPSRPAPDQADVELI